MTVLWASSWVIIKFGLSDIPPITFSGLRYSIASLILLGVIVSNRQYRDELKGRKRPWWTTLASYGVVFVAVTQGAQFVALSLLEAITVSTLLNLTPLVVLVLGVLILQEVPTRHQIVWIMVGITGVLLFLYPVGEVNLLGLVVVACGILANAFSSIMGRKINRRKEYTPVVVTGVSMSIGSLLLLIAAVLVEGITPLSLLSIGYILWLSIVNTAFAFTLWNRAMRTLRALDISIINGTMMPQIVLLSIVFLGELPELLDWIGILLVGLSALIVQVIQARHMQKRESIQDGEE